MIITGAVSYLLVFCTYRFLIKCCFKRKMNRKPGRQNLFFSMLAAIQMISIAHIGKTVLMYSDVLLLFAGLSFIFINSYRLYLFRFAANHTKMLECQLHLPEQQALMHSRNIHDLELKDQQARKSVHEARMDLNILDRLHENKEFQFSVFRPSVLFFHPFIV